MSDQPNELERQVLEKLLAGNHPVIQNLRRQLSGIQVVKRELTGTGFITSFHVQTSLITPSLQAICFKFGDVIADVENLEHGAGFLLYISDGAIDALEGYSFEEEWPERISQFRLSYVKGDKRDLSGISEPNKGKESGCTVWKT
jgi:hypothetical protein